MLLLPGGVGTVPELANDTMLNFLKDRCPKTDINMSVCSGSALFAKAGLLDGLRATSNKMFFALAVIERVFGADRARMIAEFTEYQWHTDADADPFAKFLNQADPAMLG